MTHPPSAITLPAAFVARTRALLGDEAGAFFAAYERPPVAGLRVNPLKLSPEQFAASCPWPLEPVPWAPDGFVISDEARPGRHPFHAAGLYYLQEPSAMAVVEALDLRPGQAVLDLAAAPGGKATQIAGKLGDAGVLVANELIPSRIKPLGENLERWGTHRALVTNDEPERLARAFGPIFDRVLLDTPCSGEGMFRKSPAALREWSPEHVAGCAVRQEKILAVAARLVKPGGSLFYSTCTFAVAENEAVIAEFLANHPAWELIDIPKRHGFRPGRADWADSGLPLERTARLWPHLLTGEGHFLALLRNGGEGPVAGPSAAPRARRERDQARPPAIPPASIAAWRAWCNDALAAPPTWLRTNSEGPESLREQGGTLFLAPLEALPAGLRIVRPGLPLGAAKPGRFEPAHALALALPPGAVRQTVDLTVAEAERYLAGEPLARPGSPGWLLVTVAGWPLGWGKRSGEIVKNHYPKGLRRPLITGALEASVSGN